MFAEQLSELLQNLSHWEWYTSFKFGAMWPHLPDNWEHILDGAQDKIGWGGLVVVPVKLLGARVRLYS